MPYPSDSADYEAMASQEAVISSAIESLDVQVSWSNVKIVGASPAGFEPLVDALNEGVGGLADALARFTRQLYIRGTIFVFVDASSEFTRVFPLDWQGNAEAKQRWMPP